MQLYSPVNFLHDYELMFRNIDISGELKPYQIQALNWLIQRHDNGAGCILADEMGLGKTLETLSLIGHLMKERGEKGPFLIITPKSTTGNWMNEIKRWTPFAKAIFLGGVKEERVFFLSLYFFILIVF